MPADEWQLVRFARYLANYVTSYNTVQNYLSLVKKLHRLAGFKLADPDEPNLALLLRGLKAELANLVRQSKPITPRILWDIYQVISVTDVVDVVCYTALLIGFYLFLRSSNLVPRRADGFQPGIQLARGHVSQQGKLTLIEIHWSKTIQYRQKVLILPLILSEVKQICPVFWLKNMMSKVPAGPQDPLFSLPTGMGNKALTYDKLRTKLSQWIVATGRPEKDFSLHGLRRGGASWGLQSGITGPEIQAMGDWASLAYLRYLDTDLERRVKSMVQFVDEVNMCLF